MVSYVNGMPFSFPEVYTLWAVLQADWHIHEFYMLPSYYQIRTTPKNDCYATHRANCKKILLKDVELYGIHFQGDGASIRNTPLLNVKAGGMWKPVVVQDIVECTKHLQQGWKQDAAYVKIP